MTRLALLLVACTGCQMAVPPPEGPLTIAGAKLGPARDASSVAVYAGRPERAYEPIAFVSAQAIFSSPLASIRAQAASVGADAVIEVETGDDMGGPTASGLAVRFR